MRQNLLIVFTCLLLPASLFGQLFKDVPAITRDILLDQKDSTIKTAILISATNKQINKEKTYYWYFNDVIKQNQGGYFGDLLHGSYVVYDPNKNMMTKGELNRGLKTGEWKYWYKNGRLKAVISWKNGERDGLAWYYDTAGNIIKRQQFREDKLHGKVIIYNLNGENEIAYYKKGRVVDQKNQNKLMERINAIFKKEQPEDNAANEKE